MELLSVDGGYAFWIHFTQDFSNWIEILLSCWQMLIFMLWGTYLLFHVWQQLWCRCLTIVCSSQWIGTFITAKQNCHRIWIASGKFFCGINSDWENINALNRITVTSHERHDVPNYRQLHSFLLVYSGAHQRKHQSSDYRSFVKGIHWWLSAKCWPFCQGLNVFNNSVVKKNTGQAVSFR